jgi:DNA-binding transcriptional LysR family regulator
VRANSSAGTPLQTRPTARTAWCWWCRASTRWPARLGPLRRRAGLGHRGPACRQQHQPGHAQAAAAAGRALHQRIQVTSLDAMCRMIDNGLGVGLLPDRAFR